MNIVWREITRNCHRGELDGAPVLIVERPQKNRPDGSKHDWRIIVLGDRYTWGHVFNHHDPRDLESTKSAAEKKLGWAVERLFDALKKPGGPASE